MQQVEGSVFNPVKYIGAVLLQPEHFFWVDIFDFPETFLRILFCDMTHSGDDNI